MTKQATVSRATVTIRAVAQAERAAIKSYAAIIVHAILDGKSNERGYATELRKELQLAAAQNDYTATQWEKLDDKARDAAKDVYFSRFKKLTEKSVTIAGLAAEKGLDLSLVHDAEQTQAITSVYNWLTGHCKATDINTLWAAFNFSTGAKPKAVKPAPVTTTQPEAEAATTATPAPQPEAETESMTADEYADMIISEFDAMPVDMQQIIAGRLMARMSQVVTADAIKTAMAVAA